MERDRRLTGFMRGQTDKPHAPPGFELNNPWRVRRRDHGHNEEVLTAYRWNRGSCRPTSRKQIKHMFICFKISRLTSPQPNHLQYRSCSILFGLLELRGKAMDAVSLSCAQLDGEMLLQGVDPIGLTLELYLSFVLPMYPPFQVIIAHD
jgi:hypothetical protein